MTMTVDIDFKCTGDLGQTLRLEDNLEGQTGRGGIVFSPGSEEVCVKMQMNVK